MFDRYNIVSTDDVMDALRKLELAALNETRKPVQSLPAKKHKKHVVALSSNG